ncbi:MAG: ABC transporter ATP-binding protein [archaeon]
MAKAVNILEAKSITKSFKEQVVLKGVSFAIKEGEILGLLGPNAAGKSTLSKIVMGRLKADSGKIIFRGNELNYNKNIISSHFSLVPQEEYFYKDFTVKDNLDFFGLIYNLDETERENKREYLIKWLNLSRFRNKKASEMSGGYRRLLNIACSLCHEPDIIFMDEPTVALDPAARKDIWDKILELKKLGKTVVITTHYIHEAEYLCDEVVLLMEGRVLEQGSPKKLVSKYKKKNLEEVFMKVTSSK